MRRNIIVEGFDGTGKDTLIRELHDYLPFLTEHPRFSTSLAGPIARGDELAALVADDMVKMGDADNLVIYNRHPLISEPFYCYLRGGPQGVWNSGPWLDAGRRELGRYAALVICQPPLEVVRANLLRNPKDQMPGVVENIDSLYKCYAEMAWPGPTIRYDYTRDTAATVVALLRKVMD